MHHSWWSLSFDEVMFRISAPSYMSKRLPGSRRICAMPTTFSEPRGPKLTLQSNFRFDDHIGAAHVPGAVRNGKGPTRLEPEELDPSPSLQLAPGRPRPRVAHAGVYSCGRERWRYCIACLSCTHFSFAECRASRA